MKFLTAKATSIFEELSDYKLLSDFTLVGGSAIAYYLNHRLSEDLDFFSWNEFLPAETDSFINKISKNRKVVIANKTKNYLDIFIDDIKLTLFANEWNVLKTDRKKITGNVYVAELPLLVAMKINTLSLRAKFRDYYDLYVLNKEKFSIEDMYKFGIKYIPGLTKKIFTMQLTYTDDIEDESILHLTPKYKVSLTEIQKNFEVGLEKII